MERSPAADFSKLFQQYSKHLASFSVNLGVEEKNTNTKSFTEASIGKINDKSAFDSVKAFELPKLPEKPIEKHFEIPKPFELSKPFEFTVKPAENPVVESFELPKPVETLKPFEFKPMQFAPAPIVEVVNKEPEVIEIDESGSEAEDEDEPSSEREPKTEAPKFSFGAAAIAPVIEKTTEKVAETATFAPFSFGSSATSASSSEMAKPFSFGNSFSAAGEIPAFKSFSFGATASESTFPGTTVTSSTESPAPFKPFSFGSIAETPKLNITSVVAPASASVASNTLSFGASSSVFSFGVPVTTPTAPPPVIETKQIDASAPKFSFGSSSIGGLAPLPTFSFGAPSASGFSFNPPTVTATTPVGKYGELSDDGGDEIPPEEAESFSLTRTNTDQLKTGAGEENETCQYEQRCKVFMMDSSDSWIDLGVGIFKINRYNNESGKSRVLCRSEGNGKVILNALVIVPGMNVSSTEGKKEVALLAIGPEGKLVKYLIRVKTLEQAGEFKTAVLNEIEYVKSGKTDN